MKTFMVLLAIVGLTFADDLAKCICQEGFIAKQEENGNVRCYGLILKSIMPCNVPRKPRCICGPEVTGIINDGSGTWCGRYDKGKEVKRWGCENKAEWDTFYAQHPDRQPPQNTLVQ